MTGYGPQHRAVEKPIRYGWLQHPCRAQPGPQQSAHALQHAPQQRRWRPGPPHSDRLRCQGPSLTAPVHQVVRQSVEPRDGHVGIGGIVGPGTEPGAWVHAAIRTEQQIVQDRVVRFSDLAESLARVPIRVEQFALPQQRLLLLQLPPGTPSEAGPTTARALDLCPRGHYRNVGNGLGSASYAKHDRPDGRLERTI
jgi:hypothetical protein